MQERVSDSLLVHVLMRRAGVGLGVWTGTLGGGEKEGILFLLSCYCLLDLGSF